MHLTSISNERNAPNLSSRTRTTYLIFHPEEIGPNLAILHEFIFQLRPASRTMSENPTLCGHLEIAPTDPLFHGSNVQSSAVSQGQHTLTLGPPGELGKKERGGEGGGRETEREV